MVLTKWQWNVSQTFCKRVHAFELILYFFSSFLKINKLKVKKITFLFGNFLSFFIFGGIMRKAFKECPILWGAAIYIKKYLSYKSNFISNFLKYN